MSLINQIRNNYFYNVGQEERSIGPKALFIAIAQSAMGITHEAPPTVEVETVEVNWDDPETYLPSGFPDL